MSLYGHRVLFLLATASVQKGYPKLSSISPNSVRVYPTSSPRDWKYVEDGPLACDSEWGTQCPWTAVLSALEVYVNLSEVMESSP